MSYQAILKDQDGNIVGKTKISDNIGVLIRHDTRLRPITRTFVYSNCSKVDDETVLVFIETENEFVSLEKER